MLMSDGESCSWNSALTFEQAAEGRNQWVGRLSLRITLSLVHGEVQMSRYNDLNVTWRRRTVS